MNELTDNQPLPSILHMKASHELEHAVAEELLVPDPEEEQEDKDADTERHDGAGSSDSN